MTTSIEHTELIKRFTVGVDRIEVALRRSAALSEDLKRVTWHRTHSLVLNVSGGLHAQAPAVKLELTQDQAEQVIAALVDGLRRWTEPIEDESP